MDYSCRYLPYSNTHSFKKIVTDYLQLHPNLESLYAFTPNKAGVEKAIANRRQYPVNRHLLVEYFSNEYAGKTTDLQSRNIQLLADNNCFTVTTAHQPNIFTGPLYFIYKILHAIQLAGELSSQFPDYKFVPVYYMGSEDADLDELGNITLQGKKLAWQTNQTGAVGRMKADKQFLQLITEVEGQLAVNTYGKELCTLLKQCYTAGKTIQQATFELVNALFGQYGLLVLIPDNHNLKQAFVPIIQKELFEQFSHTCVAQSNAQLSQHYKIQAAGRDLNLFYLIDDKRERIEKKGNGFFVEKLGLKFSAEEMQAELNSYPERFSPNVILRPVFQETILPNIAFICGGGEIAYWLQLKNVFDEVKMPYPVLILRNSFLLYKKEQELKLQKMGLSIENLFSDTQELIKQFVSQQSSGNCSLEKQMEEARQFYLQLAEQAASVDISLKAHTESIASKAIKKMAGLETKMLRAEKRKYTDQLRQLTTIQQALFPSNSLQERTENFGYYYSIYGKNFLDMLLACSKGLEQEFALLALP